MNASFSGFCCLFFCLLAGQLHAQTKAYFQQQADYKISVSLDDKKHFLRGSWSLEYKNNSPDTLTFIYIHLYPNAYKNNRTALGRQLTRTGNLEWYFDKEEARGYIDSLDFRSNGQPLQWALLPDDSIDIAKINLAQPLLPNQSISLQSPFRVKIPKSVSRLGHVDNAYQITQWYPKPAVYDRYGWHQMPYLNQGEFFSEYGSFEVDITVPENYVVGASGDLLTDSEHEFLQQKADFTKKYDFDALNPDRASDTVPPSSAKLKTLKYKIQNAHDFAFFADKNFFVLIDSARVDNRSIRTYAMFTKNEAQLWQKASLYLRRSVEFYSDVVGAYPYNQVTAVQSALGAGGGMEYPTITVIGLAGSPNALETVIMHEVGHNWFYGILGSNERVYAWLDEGLNSYVESRYKDVYQGKEPFRQDRVAYLYQARRGEEQPICTHSESATPLNYYLTAYGKPTLLFRHLERYLGTEKMDSILQLYFDNFKFRHPYPDDLQQLFEQQTGENMDWFFKDWLNTTKVIDYAITKQRFADGQLSLTIKNKGELTIPIGLDYRLDTSSQLQTIWVKNLSPNQDTTISIPATNQTTVQLDAFQNVPDIQPNNNQKSRFAVGMLPNISKLEQNKLLIWPTMGFNSYNGFMLGLAAFNLPVPLRRFQYLFNPFYGFGSNSLAGSAELEYNHIPSQSRPYKRLSIGLSARSYDNFRNETYDYQTRYTRLANFIEIELPRKPANSQLSHEFSLQNILIGEERAIFSAVTNLDTVYYTYDGKQTKWRSLHRLQYNLSNRRKLNPYKAQLSAEYGNYHSFATTQHFVKLSAEYTYTHLYNEFSGLTIRAFAGGFVYHSDRNFGIYPLQTSSRNLNDYHYDQQFLGRRQQEGFLSQQIAIQDGGFKTNAPQSVADGHSNKFLAAINLKSGLPIRLNIGMKWVQIKPYFDAAIVLNSEPSLLNQDKKYQTIYNGGLMLDISNGMAGIYFPLFSSRDLANSLNAQSSYLRNITFSLNTRALSPFKAAHKLELQ